MIDLGKLKYFLGSKIIQTMNDTCNSQQKYVEGLLRKFQMEGCNAVSTPINTSEKRHADDNSSLADAKLFRSIIGGLMYVSHTRPDIMYDVAYIISGRKSYYSN